MRRYVGKRLFQKPIAFFLYRGGVDLSLLKKKPRLTIIVIPHSRGPTFSLCLSQLFMPIVFLILLAIAILVAVSFRNYRIAENKLSIMADIELENCVLQENMQQLMLETEELKIELSEMSVLSNEIKLLAESTSICTGKDDENRTFEERQENMKSIAGRGNMFLDRAYDNIYLLQQSIPEESAALVQLKDDLQEYHQRLSCTPSIWPTRGQISSRFGMRCSPFTGRKEMHYGLDIAAPRGTNIYAAADGKVIQAAYRKGLGYSIIIEHGYGFKTLYAHLASFAVNNGDYVQKDQIIGHVGSTGYSTGPHLHYEVHLNGIAVNPEGYLEIK